MGFSRIISAAVLAVGAPAAAVGGLSLSSSPSEAQSDEAATAFVECMRSNGVADFPDATVVDGRLVLDQDGAGIDPFSDAYREALAACEGELPEGTEMPTDPEPPSAPPSPEDGDMPPAAPAAPAAPTLPG